MENAPNQTKEEEIGSLPEKEFRIMIVKMIQNLENKMELQINSLETRIEKMQECSSVSKESACSAGDPGSIPGLERPSGEGNGNPLHYS